MVDTEALILFPLCLDPLLRDLLKDLLVADGQVDKLGLSGRSRCIESKNICSVDWHFATLSVQSIPHGRATYAGLFVFVILIFMFF